MQKREEKLEKPTLEKWAAIKSSPPPFSPRGTHCVKVTLEIISNVNFGAEIQIASR